MNKFERLIRSAYPESPFLSPTQAAKLLGMHLNAFRRSLRRGTLNNLPATYINDKAIRIVVEDLADFMQAREKVNQRKSTRRPGRPVGSRNKKPQHVTPDFIYEGGK